MAIMSKWLVAVIIFVIGYAIETVLIKWQAGLKVKWPINILTVINGILCSSSSISIWGDKYDDFSNFGWSSSYAWRFLNQSSTRAPA